jgi:predicted O-linked N-acetylglucosamine transferase (SPINDLY family)
VGHFDWGVALGLEGQLKEAVGAYRKAIGLKGDEAQYHFNLGSALKDMGKPVEAAEAFRSAIGVRANYPEAYNNLGIVLKEAGMLEEAFAAYRKAVELKPDYADAHSNLLMGLHYWEGSTAESLYEEHLEWARRYAEPVTKFNRPHVRRGDGGKKLRVGYVAGAFWSHAAARFILPLLANHDRERFEIFGYANVGRGDAVTERIRGYCDGWRNIFGMGDEQAAGLIRDDRVDILVDLSLHSAWNRMLVFARKPAPVQVTWLGYAGTTGMSAVDWRFTDRWLDPDGADVGVYSEKSAWLPGCFWC